MQTKHTPGPWAVCEDASGDTFVAAMMDSAQTICEFGCADNDSDQAQIEADARLVAAAPDLLEALEWATAEIDGRTRYAPDCHYTALEQRENAIDKARAAIARARGQ